MLGDLNPLKGGYVGDYTGGVLEGVSRGTMVRMFQVEKVEKILGLTAIISTQNRVTHGLQSLI